MTSTITIPVTIETPFKPSRIELFVTDQNGRVLDGDEKEHVLDLMSRDDGSNCVYTGSINDVDCCFRVNDDDNYVAMRQCVNHDEDAAAFQKANRRV